jgi:hypothetical protein
MATTARPSRRSPEPIAREAGGTLVRRIMPTRGADDPRTARRKKWPRYSSGRRISSSRPHRPHSSDLRSRPASSSRFSIRRYSRPRPGGRLRRERRRAGATLVNVFNRRATSWPHRSYPGGQRLPAATRPDDELAIAAHCGGGDQHLVCKQVAEEASLVGLRVDVDSAKDVACFASAARSRRRQG